MRDSELCFCRLRRPPVEGRRNTRLQKMSLTGDPILSDGWDAQGAKSWRWRKARAPRAPVTGELYASRQVASAPPGEE
jgi:hypothetical protein